MISLHDLIDPGLLREAILQGDVKVTSHPCAQLQILNYSRQAAYNRTWNPATTTCRGLIINRRTNKVVSRPFSKFFGHTEPDAPQIPLDDFIMATDKEDGSLGIMYPAPFGWAIATRGSFTSPQALHGTRMLRKIVKGGWRPNPAWTYLFEIIYPENRIVLDYGDREELILIGAVDTETGRSVNPVAVALDWPGSSVEVLPYTTLREALSAPPRDNAEGLVVWHPQTDARVKIKQEDYVYLHRLFTNTNAIDLWELRRNGWELDEHAMPEEFRVWAHAIFADLDAQFEAFRAGVTAEFNDLSNRLHPGFTRKELALAARGTINEHFMYALHDGADALVADMIWKRLRPSGSKPMRTLDAAA